MSGRNSRAFTLIEVLVVVAIIALLVAVLVPSLNAARDQAQTVVCKTRLAELYRGHIYYAQDNKQYFPHFNWWLWDAAGGEPQTLNNPSVYVKTGGVRSSDSRMWVTYGQIYRYVRDKEVYFCPKDSKRRNGGIGSSLSGFGLAIHSYSRCFEPHYFALWQKTGKSYSGGTWPQDGKIDSTDFLRVDTITTATMGTAARSAVGAPCTTTADRVALMFEEWQTADDVLQSASGDGGFSDLNDGYSAPMLSAGDHITTRHRKSGHLLYWDGHSSLVDGAKLNFYPPHYDGGSVPANQRYAAVVMIGANKQ